MCGHTACTGSYAKARRGGGWSDTHDVAAHVAGACKALDLDVFFLIADPFAHKRLKLVVGQCQNQAIDLDLLHGKRRPEGDKEKASASLLIISASWLFSRPSEEMSILISLLLPAVQAAREAARRTLDAAGVTLVADCKPDHRSFSPQEETALALALREAVTNIVRHARATTCCLRFVSDAGHRRLVVEDDGEHAVVREGNGLRGMRERIESLGGRFSLECGNMQNHGTRLIIDLPSRQAAAS